MLEPVPNEVLNVIDRFTDKCVKERIYWIVLKQGALNTFFRKEALAHELRELHVGDLLQGLYSWPRSGTPEIALKQAFQRFADQYSLEVLQQRISERLERRIADFARQQNLATIAREHERPIYLPVAEPRLFLWL